MTTISNRIMLIGVLVVLCWLRPAHGQDEWNADRLWDAAQKSEMENVKAAIAAGVDVDAKTRYGTTALFFACDRGNLEMVNVLLEAGASPNVKDTFYQATPVSLAHEKGHQKIVGQLLKSGATGVNGFLLSAIASKNVELAKLAIESGNVTPAVLNHARKLANSKNETELSSLFKNLQIDEPETIQLSAEQKELLKGNYSSSRMRAEITIDEDKLMISINSGTKTALEPIAENKFLMKNTPVGFAIKDRIVKLLTISRLGNNVELTPTVSVAAKPTIPDPAPADPDPTEMLPSSRESIAADLSISSVNWPSFRGSGARGIGEGQNPPTEWNVPENDQLLWKTAIPGLGLSCPSVWGDRIFVTSAVNEDADTKVKTGLYGSVDPVEEDFSYQFNIYCVDKQTGKILWEKTAHESKPAVKRHPKSSHANPTVATDGKHVVAFFGSEGIYCYSMNGDLIWNRSFGVLDSGWFYDAGYQWGFGSSPIIFEDKVIVQCDIQKGSFIAALNIETGAELWKIPRDEIPTWSTPTVHQFDELAMLITHGTKAARGYDARSGELLWTLPEHSEIVVPSPFVAHNRIFIASGYSPIQPIYAILPSARGDISLPDNASDSQYVAWSYQRGGPYMPSPIVYGDYMYCCSNSGILTCYNATTGKRAYRQRLKAGGSARLSFTASPIAGDGRLYLTSEDGRVLVVKAGPTYELLATNPVGESILATPAISDGKMIFRTQGSLIAVGK